MRVDVLLDKLNDNNVIKKESYLDVKLTSCIIGIFSALFFMFGLLLIIGVGHFTETDIKLIARPALFGVIWLASEFGIGINLLIVSSLGLCSAYGIWKKYRYGWWSLLVWSAYNFLNDMLMFSKFKVFVTITSLCYIGIFIWLFYRKNFYLKK